MVPSLPLLSCESSVSVKENPDRKKNQKKKSKKKKTPKGTYILKSIPEGEDSLFYFLYYWS